MKIFVISLKNAAERRASATNQFRNLNLDFQFFDAIEDVGSVPAHFKAIDKTLYRWNTLREPHVNEIGCYASHLALWKTCLKLKQPIMILEDDFRLADQFAEAVPLIKTLAQRYGFIRLEGFERRRKPLKRLRPAAYLIDEYNASRLYYLSDVPLCMLAYAISPQAAKSLVKSSATLIAPVDKFLQQTWVHNTPIHALSPALVGLSACADLSTIGIRPRKSLNPWWLIQRAIYKSKGEMKRIGFDRQQLKRLGANGVLQDRRANQVLQ